MEPKRTMTVPAHPTARRTPLTVLVAETAGSRALRRLVRPARRVRIAVTQQECADLAYARAADVMLVDLDAPEFNSPESIGRIRFIARNAFPVLGVTRHPQRRAEGWFQQGLSDLLPRSGLTAGVLDRKLRHWVKHHRMRQRLARAEQATLQWWCSLADGLDEVRARLVERLDAAEAHLSLAAGREGAEAEARALQISHANQQLAEVRQMAEELALAARRIRGKGILRSRQDNLAGKRVLLPEGWLRRATERKTAERWVDLPRARSSSRREEDRAA